MGDPKGWMMFILVCQVRVFGGVENSISHCSAECVCLTSSAWPNEAAGYWVVTSLQLLQAMYQQHKGTFSRFLGHSPGLGVLCVSVDGCGEEKERLVKVGKMVSSCVVHIGRVHHGKLLPVTHSSSLTPTSSASWFSFLYPHMLYHYQNKQVGAVLALNG